VSISRIAWRVVRVGIYTLLAGVVVFFALTRTEVGRDRIRQQLQSAFNARFAGTLQIGSLQGTLLNDLIATDVTLRDENGRVVASIDSVHSQPRWNDVLTAQVSARTLTLVRPHLQLRRRADGRWNVQQALSRSTPVTGNGSLNLSLSQVTIRDGRVTTRRDGQAPVPVQNRWLFDYTESTLDRLNAEATIEWTDTDLIVENNNNNTLRWNGPSEEAFSPTDSVVVRTNTLAGDAIINTNDATSYSGNVSDEGIAYELEDNDRLTITLLDQSSGEIIFEREIRA